MNKIAEKIVLYWISTIEIEHYTFFIFCFLFFVLKERKKVLAAKKVFTLYVLFEMKFKLKMLACYVKTEYIYKYTKGTVIFLDRLKYFSIIFICCNFLKS